MSADAIEEELTSSDPEVRRQAVRRLSCLPTALEEHDRILSALNDSDWRVRREAIALASQVTDRAALAHSLLEEILGGGTVGLRNSAIEVLGRIGQGMRETFTAAYERADEGSRRFVIEAMGKTCDPLLLEALEGIVDSADGTAAAAAVEALGSIGGPRAEQILRSRLGSPDLFLRVAVLEGLTRLGTRLSWNELRVALDHTLVRRIAAELLGRTGHPEALEWLVGLAADASIQTRSAALRAIAELACGARGLSELVAERLSSGSRPLRRTLYDALMNGDTATREAAALLAVLTRDESCLEAVLNVLADDLVDIDTVELLRGWGGELVEPLLQLRGAEPRIWAIALGLAADLAYAHRAALAPSVLERVRHALDLGLESSSEATRAAAAAGLASWADAADCARLVDCLRSPSDSIRGAARNSLMALCERMPDQVERALQGLDLRGPGAPETAAVLSRLSSPATVATLKRGLQSSEARTRRAVVQALTMSQGSDVVELIGYAVADEDVDVQLSAVRSLGQMSVPEAEGPLRTALASTFPTTRAEAALALGRRGVSSASAEILQLLEDGEAVVVAAAVDAMGLLKDVDVASISDKALAHADDEVFKAGLRASACLSNEEAERRLKRGLEHHAWHVRLLAVELLEARDSESSKRLLEQALAAETDAMVRQAVVGSLDREP